MGQPIVQYFITQSDDGGAKKFVQSMGAVKGSMKDVGSEASVMGSRVDSVINRVQRPLGKFVFRDIAMQASGMTDSLKGAGSATAATMVGIQALGTVAMGFTGTIGIAVVAISAFASILYKLKGDANSTSEALKQKIATLRTQSDEYKKASEVLQRMNYISAEEANILRNSAGEKTKEIRLIEEKIKARRVETEAVLKGQMVRYHWTEEMVKSGVVNQKFLFGYKEYIAAVQASTTVLDEATKKEDERNKKTEYALQLKSLLFEKTVEAERKSGDYVAILDMEVIAQQEVNAAEADYISALATGDAKAIESANIRVEAKRKELAAVNTAKNSMLASQKELAAKIMQYSGAISGAVQWQNEKLVFNAKKAGADLIRLAANQAAAELAIMAAKYLWNPATVGLGIAAAAAAAAVMTIGSAAASLMEGPGGTAGGGSGSGGGGQAAQSENKGNPINLTLKFEGKNVGDKDFVAVVAKSLNKYVIESNGVLVSSKVSGSGSQNAGALAG